MEKQAIAGKTPRRRRKPRSELLQMVSLHAHDDLRGGDRIHKAPALALGVYSFAHFSFVAISPAADSVTLIVMVGIA
jgi:hypothetical protein